MTHTTTGSSSKGEKAVESSSQRQEKGVLERHVQTILSTIATSAILALVVYVYDDNRQKATFGVQLDVLSRQIAEVRQDIRALQNANVTRPEYRELELRVRALENGKGRP